MINLAGFQTSRSGALPQAQIALLVSNISRADTTPSDMSVLIEQMILQPI
jgi:hypothetical protein